jgi:hypothetical protein
LYIFAGAALFAFGAAKTAGTNNMWTLYDVMARTSSSPAPDSPAALRVSPAAPEQPASSEKHAPAPHQHQPHVPDSERL